MAKLTNKKETASGSSARFPRRKASAPPPRGTVTAIDLDGPMLRIVQGSQTGTEFQVERVAVEKMELPEAKGKEEAKGVGLAMAKALSQAQVRASQIVMG